MFISVHLTTFCQAQSGWLSNAVESVLNQSHRAFELIIYDDASYDGTAELLKSYQNSDQRIRVIRGDTNVNSVSKSLGACFLAKSPKTAAVTWMFDDNVLHPGALEALAAEMIASGADVVYGQTRIKTKEGGYWDIGVLTPSAIAAGFNDTSAAVPNAGILIKPDVFDKAGWYDPNITIRRSCDWDLFRRIWASTDRISKIDYLCATEFGELSATSLRNVFDTSFPLMSKYVRLRDNHGFRLDVLSAVHGPADVIPEGDWTPTELYYIYRTFVRYFVSVGNLAKGFEWGQALIEATDTQNDLIYRNLKSSLSPKMMQAVIAGMFAGRIESSAAPIMVVMEPLPLKTKIANHLRTKIRNSESRLGGAFWRLTFRAGQYVWLRRPRW